MSAAGAPEQAAGAPARVPADPGAPARVPADPTGPAAAGSTAEGTEAGRARVLLVEDDSALLSALRINLRVRRYRVATARTGREALAEAGQRPPDAVILDLGLPDMDGVSVIRVLRGWSRVPVIVLSGRSASADKIGALDAGADDYVTKPFAMEELLARLRAALRREESGPASARVLVGRWEVDLAARAVRPAGADPGPGGLSARLTPTEWRLLEILARHPGQLIPSRRLLAEIWGPGAEDSGHYLRFHMARLRRKLEDDPSRPRHLLTEPGMGYRLAL